MADILETPERSAPIIALIANAGDMAGMFSDIDRLRDGEYMRAWHSFPTTKEDLQATLKEIGLDGANAGDCVIIDYKTNISGLYDRLPFGADVDEINYLADRLLNEVRPHNIPIFEGVMQSGRHCDSLRDIINVTENLDCFDIQPAYSLEQYGEFLAEMGRDEYAGGIERLEKSHDPDMRDLAVYIGRLEQYFDETAYVRDVVKAENGQFIPCGYLTESGEFVELYNDKHDIPDNCRVSAFPNPEREPAARASVMDKLAAAKEVAGKVNADKSDRPPKSHDAEL